MLPINFNYDDKPIRTLSKEDGSIWFCLKDITVFLGIKNNNQVASMLPSVHKDKALFKDALNRNQQNYNVISLEGLYILVSRTQSSKTLDLLNVLKLDKPKILKTIYHEQNYISIIIKAINGFIDYKTQFQISKYRIDLYIPSLKLAIECDEKSHLPYAIKDKQREDEIKKLLNCQFLRFNPDDPNFNIGNVINTVLKKYLKNSVKGEIYEFTKTI